MIQIEYKGLTLDKFQEDAIASIDANKSVVVSAPTGSGKTLIADYIIDRDIKRAKRIIYTAPIKALSNQKFKDFCREYGSDKIGLLTGDTSINPRAQVLIMTTEIYRNMVLVKDETIDTVSYVILDEIHYINDIDRGYVWEESIIFSPPNVRFLCLSATIPNSKEFADWIESIKSHQVDTVLHHIRNVPLRQHFYEEGLGICSLDDLRELSNIPVHKEKRRFASEKIKAKDKTQISGPNHLHLINDIGIEKMPCLFFCFSRVACQKHAVELANHVKWNSNPEIIRIVSDRMSKMMSEIKMLKTTRMLRNVLPKGIGFHHAGLIPVLKELVEELFGKGLLKVLYATETFAVGINMPAKTVCFNSLRKFSGINFRLLNSKEYFQMAGRAGRRGMDTEGYVYAMMDMRDFNYVQIFEMTSDDKIPLRSQFKLSVNTALNMIHRHTDAEINEILKKSLYTFQSKSRGIVLEKTFWNMVGKLEKMGYIKDRKLTTKGVFASKMFCDEIEFTEFFQTGMMDNYEDYFALLLIAALAYEERRDAEFKNEHVTKKEKQLYSAASKIMDRRAKYIYPMTALFYPLFTAQKSDSNDASPTFFDIAKNTTIEEGDLLRFFNQVLDRIGQLRRAADTHALLERLERCESIIRVLLKDISGTVDDDYSESPEEPDNTQDSENEDNPENNKPAEQGDPEIKYSDNYLNKP